MTDADIEIEQLKEAIIGCGIEVHRTLGPGLLESVYRECLLIEIRKQGLPAVAELQVPFVYKGIPLNGVLKLDLLIDNRVVVEVKAVEQYHPVHRAQLVTYLKLTGHPAGLLMNFNVPSLRSGLRRADHPDRYRPKFSSGVDDSQSEIGKPTPF
jgi:GxxExxY protein